MERTEIDLLGINYKTDGQTITNTLLYLVLFLFDYLIAEKKKKSIYQLFQKQQGELKISLKELGTN